MMRYCMQSVRNMLRQSKCCSIMRRRLTNRAIHMYERNHFSDFFDFQTKMNRIYANEIGILVSCVSFHWCFGGGGGRIWFIDETMNAVVGINRKFGINIYARYNAIDIGRASQQLWNSKVVARSWSHIAHATWCPVRLWWMCSIELIRFATTFAVTYQCLSGIIIQFAYRSKVCYVCTAKYFSSSTHAHTHTECIWYIHFHFAHHHWSRAAKLRKAKQKH